MKLTADQLVQKGMELFERGHNVVLLLPTQEWMAEQTQMPFMRYEKIPTDGDGKHRKR